MSCSSENVHYCKAGTRAQFQAVIVPDFDRTYSTPVSEPGNTEELHQLLMRDARGSCKDNRTCSWWWITVHPKSVLRTGQPNGAPPPVYVPENFAPLAQSDILQRGQVCSSLRVKLTLSDQTARQRELVVDVGPGFAMPWYGTAVQIEVVTFPDPSRIYQIVPIPNPQSLGLDKDAQVVEESVIEANAVTVETCSRGESLPLTYTQVRTNAAGGATLAFPKPPGARRASFYTSNGSPSGIHWSVIPGDAVQQPIGFIGQVEPSPLQANTSVGRGFNVPGPACALVMLGANAGTYTVVWEIEP